MVTDKGNKLTAAQIWNQYEQDRHYKNNLNLYEKVKQQENFFIGNQWEGVKAPDLPKPVINVVKRVTNYLISVLIVDNIGISFRGYTPNDMDNMEQSNESRLLEDVLPKEIERILENTKFRSKTRLWLKNAAVSGGACSYSRFDLSKENGEKGQPTKGEIETEIVPITNLHLGNTLSAEIEQQPYIIISKFVPTKELKKQYAEKAEEITADGDDYDMMPQEQENDVTTVLIYMRKINGKVYVTTSCRKVILEDEKDTGLQLYPVAFFNWENVSNQCHGVGVVEEIIPNQIAINKLWAMAILYQQNNAFPKVFFDKTKIEKWDNRVGAVIGTIGNPNEAMASSFRAHDMSAQVINLVERTIGFTKEFMGANDAVLGNINPQNTSALIQLQKASAAPLELQRLAFYQFIEDHIRILVEIIKNKYGYRYVQNDDEVTAVDFSRLEYNSNINVEIGASSSWSETAQIQTMDNLFQKGIIQDAKLYVDSIPEKLLPNKKTILSHLDEVRAQQEALAMMQQIGGGIENEQMQMQ